MNGLEIKSIPADEAREIIARSIRDNANPRPYVRVADRVLRRYSTADSALELVEFTKVYSKTMSRKVVRCYWVSPSGEAVSISKKAFVETLKSYGL